MLTAAECQIFKEGKRILTEYPGGFKCQGDKFVCGAKLTVQSTFLCSYLMLYLTCSRYQFVIIIIIIIIIINK